MGITGYMPFLDSPDMWKNMFDLTPIHPNYPEPLTSNIVKGKETYLDQIMQIRYYVSNYLNYYDGPFPLDGSTGGDRLTKLRQIEKQNFVMYSLCCMGGSTECFFALLQKYEPDNTDTVTTYPNKGKKYRYRWNKLIFGASGGTTYSNKIESWSLDPTIKSNGTQDSTWAINLNERGLTAGYLPPGWVSQTSTGVGANFSFRPVGMPVGSGAPSPIGGDISHIARVCIEQVDANNKLAYFWAENVLDGEC